MSTRITFNGIDVTSGEYLTPPVDAEDLARLVLDRPLEDVDEERWRLFLVDDEKAALRDGHDPKNLTEAGWGVLFAEGADPAVEQALEPLISLRRKQVDNDGRFRILRGEQGFRSGDSKIQFLKRSGVTPAGPVDPDTMPYYLLIVGSPAEIPFEFQYSLDVAYAVGRLDFDDVSGYRHYAESVVNSEDNQSSDVRTGFFGTAHPNDPATQMSAEGLVQALATAIGERAPEVAVDHRAPEASTKAALGDLLGDSGAPRLAFTATHGLGAPAGHADQQALQGALVCQDWPGPGNPMGSQHYFAASDLSPAADYGSLIAFLFACYGAGTPQLDDFPGLDRSQPRSLANAPFVGALPKALLSHEAGAALAVVGHVDRAWTYSFDWPGVGSQTAIFEDTLLRLLDGYPIGYAMEMFNERHAELAVDLNESEGLVGTADQLTAYEVAGLWTAKNDSRNYTLLGDPAVRLVSA